jgi:hypothetical protein
MGIKTTSLIRFFLLLSFQVSWATQMMGQQLGIADNHIFNMQWVNPAHVSSDMLSKVALLHQHRHLGMLGWRSNSQFLDFRSQALGKRRAFGLGFNLANDLEHTENKLGFNFSFAAKAIHTESMHLTVGINLGLINWGSNYQDIPIYQQGDPKLERGNFSDLDAGMGLSFGWQNYVVRSSIDVWGKQLPGSFLSLQREQSAYLAPHVFAGGKFLYNMGPDIFLGPTVLFHNTVSANPSIGNIGPGWLDLGLKVELDRPRMWGGAAYRLGNGAITANYGIQIMGKDTVDTRRQMASFLDLIVSANYPVNKKAFYGPNAEIGVALLFGMVGSDEDDIDTIGKMKGAFWINNGNVDTHKERYLKANAPGGLKAQTTVEEEKVYLDYEWDDLYYMYSGSNLRTGNDTLIQFLGDDWIGMDGIMEGMVREVVREALVPVHLDVENPDSVEPLKSLFSVYMAARLKFDQISAEFGAEGLIYNGELGYNEQEGDSARLRINLIYDGRDTTLYIGKGHQLNNLELCALKLNALQRKLAAELDKFYGGNFVFVTDANDILNYEEVRNIVLLGLPEIIPNNPNQEPFQVTMIELGFMRDKDWEPIVTKKKEKNKGKIDKVTRRRQRDNFRDPVVGDEENENKP